MSYCRISEDSDVYLYASVQGGWNMIVADHKYLPLSENLHNIRETPHKVFWYWMTENQIPINHVDAGKSFQFDNPEDVLSKLKQLKADGFNISNRAIKRIKSDI